MTVIFFNLFAKSKSNLLFVSVFEVLQESPFIKIMHAFLFHWASSVVTWVACVGGREEKKKVSDQAKWNSSSRQ